MKDFLYAYSDAIDESFEKGAEQGCDKERTATALDMLADDKPIEEIVKYSHLPKEKILALQKTMAAKVTK